MSLRFPYPNAEGHFFEPYSDNPEICRNCGSHRGNHERDKTGRLFPVCHCGSNARFDILCLSHQYFNDEREVNMYKIKVSSDQEYDIGMIQGGVFQAYRYPDLGVNSTADWRYVVKYYTDPDLSRFRKPGTIIDPNGNPVKTEEFLPLLDRAVMINHP
jgi:hypothetical protein